MSLPLWGLIIGAIVSVILGLLWTSGGSGIALLIPIFFVILCPIGALLGWAAQQIIQQDR
jgi:hypothetical protein